MRFRCEIVMKLGEIRTLHVELSDPRKVPTKAHM